MRRQSKLGSILAVLPVIRAAMAIAEDIARDAPCRRVPVAPLAQCGYATQSPGRDRIKTDLYVQDSKPRNSQVLISVLNTFQTR